MSFNLKDFDLKKIICEIVFYYPVFYTFLYTINPGLSNRLFRLTAWLALFACINSIFKRDKYANKNILVLVWLMIISFFEIQRTSIHNVFDNQDVFGYTGLILLCSLYLQDDYREEIISYCMNYNRYKKVIISFFALLLFGIVFKHGLRAEGWGVSVPLLYGQFEIPHSLAYILLALYALSSMQFRNGAKKFPLYMMILTFICVVWTGVRSGLIALLILVIMDFIGIKNKTKKITVIFSLTMIFVLLMSFTDVLTNNPLAQKTINAAETGTISNGREKFAAVLAAYFMYGENVFDKIVGIGINGIRDIMLLAYNVGIHAHNDFFNVLLGYGILGSVIFWGIILEFCRKAKWGIFVFVVLLILALTNGLFMYICFTPMIIFISIYVDQYFDKTGKYKGIAEQIEIKKSIFYFGS